MAIDIRPATSDDIPHVHAIYKHYVLETVMTFQQTPPPVESTLSKFQDITWRGLPYLVAVEQGKVVGYTYLSPFRGTMLSYAPTVELSLFVHREYTSKGAGSRLLSSVLAIVDSEEGVAHLAREPTGLVDSALSAPVRNVIACMALNTDGKERGEGLRRWYEDRGFEERGRLKNVGFKKGKWIDTVYLQYTSKSQSL
ncbi:hypothetical protein ASPZODRAFT_135217 [Penicilliopsis zonata CBS 506.65]|uniref:N-acetyltransferase domain-containing protein n=1 Tax=Penicilliopsis zonata CBS 506.65 TaxID=1073090 RepID=A0A1L9SB46_9EURO|nr:hypothetical protein ASPZODRAFT_135217 [Penicilliopsis zonata CBS 506.65]OJJ44394.1 hypothetical protein ASPZODRAFT_135217 [Penicilliopsis zonata CBS 506.65]